MKTINVKRPRNPFEGKRQPTVIAKIKGWSDTHVLFDVQIDGKITQHNLTRPIERFMCVYGL